MTNKYYHTKASVEEYIQLAKDVNGGELIKKLKQFLPAGSTLLELGSGPGTDWNILDKDYQVIGSDNSKEFLHHLRSSNPKGRYIALDAVTLDTDQLFDGIYANKVLHHLTDQELTTSIKRQHAILNPDGVICHSFWKGEGTEVFKGMFVIYHTEEALRDFFEEYFEIQLLESYAEFEKDDSILMIAVKKKDK